MCPIRTWVSGSCGRMALLISLAPAMVTLHWARPILQEQHLLSQFSSEENLYNPGAGTLMLTGQKRKHIWLFML